MGKEKSKTILYDRGRRILEAPDLRSYTLARAMQVSHRALAPIGYIGVSRAHGLISKIFRPTTTTLVKEGAFEFRFPSSDYYWNRLLDSSWSYEPEIDAILTRFAQTPFAFIDLGANFGFWSARVAAGLYGQHRCVAVEASNYCFQHLETNAGKENVSLHRRAIAEESGNIIPLFGQRHAGFSIDETWYGASRTPINNVESITIDDLLKEENIDCSQQPVIVKLDVEGVELRALKGAAKTIKGQSAFIIEDADRVGPSDALKYAVNELGMSIAHIQDDQLVELQTLADLEIVKAKQSRIQATGLNIVATASSFWIERFRAEYALEQKTQ